MRRRKISHNLRLSAVAPALFEASPRFARSRPAAAAPPFPKGRIASSMPSDAARPRDESGTHSVLFRLVHGRNRSALAAYR